MRGIAVFALVVGAAACAPAPQRPAQLPDQKELGARINKICSLPEPDRQAELEKLKKDTGLVLYCGKSTENPNPQ